MKTKFIKSTLFLAIAAGLVSSCVNDDDYSTPPLDCIETTLVANKQVSQIPASATVMQYTADDVVEAYVTSSDEGGNFFKSISFQTLATPTVAPIGFSVPVDATSTFASFEPGRKVLIKMKNQYTDVSNGSMRIGSIFVSGGTAQVGRIPSTEFKNVLKASCTKLNENDLVRTLTIAQAKQDANINTLIELDMVQFSDAAITTTYYSSAQDLGGATNHLLVDANGNTVIFRTSSFANYAGNRVAPGRGKVRGVMTKFGTDYQFVARTERDIQLTGPRLLPLFSQNFESITATGNNAFINLPGWSNVSMNAGAEKWEARIFSSNKYAQMSSFGTGETNTDSRLITPAINLDATAGEFLRFGVKVGFYNGVGLTLWYSNNYDGSGTAAAINAATWTQLAVPVIPTITDASYATNFYSSGNVDVSALTGNVHFAFRYQGSTAVGGVTTTYQVDNVEVYGN